MEFKKLIIIVLILIFLSGCIFPESQRGIVYQKVIIQGEQSHSIYTLNKYCLLILTEDDEFFWHCLKKKVWNNYEIGDIFPKPIQW